MRPGPRVCSEPGCPEIAPRGGKCPACKREERRALDRRRGSASHRGYGAEWREIRARVLRKRPVCCAPEGCDRLAEEVHHIVALRAGGTHDEANLLPLCALHHRRLTPSLQPGGWNA